MYVAGGNNGDGILKSLEEYDLGSGCVRNLAEMNEARDELCLLVLQDELYAVGGGGENGSNLRSMEKYSFEKNKWEFVSNMLIPRRTHTAVVVENNIYVMGGYDGEKYLCSAEK